MTETGVGKNFTITAPCGYAFREKGLGFLPDTPPDIAIFARIN